MDVRFNQAWLVHKFQEIQRRTIKAIEQLTDEQLNWRPNAASLSIATLIRHIEGNILERIEKGILHRDVKRDRERELQPIPMAKAQLIAIVTEKFDLVIETVQQLTEAQFEQTQPIRSRERTHADVLHQCAAHYSEHMGQIFYIAKQCLNDTYASTSL